MEKIHMKSQNEKMMLMTENKAQKSKKTNRRNFIEEEMSLDNDCTMFPEEEEVSLDFTFFSEDKILCVDITNQFQCQPKKGERPEDAIRNIRRDIELFVEFCRRDGYKIIGLGITFPVRRWS